LAHPDIRSQLAVSKDEPSSVSLLGLPPGREITEELFDFLTGYNDLTDGPPEIQPIYEGDRLGDWEVLVTPGHAPGHVCLYRHADRVLIAGDHLLPAVTPNIHLTDEMPDDRLQLPGTTSPGASKGSFRIRRAKTELTGWVWRHELTYELQLSWAGPEPGASTTTPLEDFILNWDASRDKRFQIAMGQFKVPLGRQELTSSNRQQFADRDLLSGEFTRGRDIGVQLWGLLAKGKVEYRAGLFNGNAASRLDTVAFRIGFGAQFCNDNSVDADLSAADQVLRMTPRRNSGAGNNFLQPLKHGCV